MNFMTKNSVSQCKSVSKSQKTLYKCRESSTNPPFYAKQTQFPAFSAQKPRFDQKTNPIQTQSNPIFYLTADSGQAGLGFLWINRAGRGYLRKCSRAFAAICGPVISSAVSTATIRPPSPLLSIRFLISPLASPGPNIRIDSAS